MLRTFLEFIEVDGLKVHHSWGLSQDQILAQQRRYLVEYGSDRYRSAFEFIFCRKKREVEANPGLYDECDTLFPPIKMDLPPVTHNNGTGNAPVDFDKISASLAKEKKAVVLPSIVKASQLVADPDIKRKPDLWNGVIRLGDKIFFGGPAKANKTWTMMGLAIAVANGVPYLDMATMKCKVLYLNFELQPGSFKERLQVISEAMRTGLDGLEIWNLRGYAAPIEVLAPQIVKMAKKDYGLIVIDPCYMSLGDRDENSAGDVADYCNILGQIEKDTGATIALGLHFAKGNASSKNAQDRTSGSGVLSRYPDTIMNITEHKDDGIMVVSTIQRDHKQIGEFCVKWDYPVFKRDYDSDPKDLKIAGIEGKPKPGVPDVLEAIGRAEMNQKALLDIMKSNGFADNSSREAIKQAISDGAIVETSREKKRGNPNVFFMSSEHAADKKPETDKTGMETDVGEGPEI